MAASYIRIAIGVLTGIAVLAMLLGYAVGKYARNVRRIILVFLAASIALFFLFAVGQRSLPVTGSLVSKQILGFWFELNIALWSGLLAGFASSDHQKTRVWRSLGWGSVCVILMIITQVRNVQPLLETLQTAGLLKPKDDYKPETNKDCPANLQSLYNAFEQYAELNDKLPEAANWEDNTDLTSRIPQDEWLHCPAVSDRHDAHFGYALNETLAGKKLNLNGKPLKTLPNASTTPLLYDSTNLSKNAHDAARSLPKPGRHSGRNNILYLDGHVAAVAPK